MQLYLSHLAMQLAPLKRSTTYSIGTDPNSISFSTLLRNSQCKIIILNGKEKYRIIIKNKYHIITKLENKKAMKTHNLATVVPASQEQSG